jgi:hypothetical protein
MQLLNISAELASLIINGEQQVDQSQSLHLGNYFKVDPTNFYDH